MRAYLLAGRIAEARGDIQQAYGSYSKALELQPDQLDAKVGLARIYLIAGQTENARKTVGEALALDARNVGARTLQAALAVKQNDLAGAEAQARGLIAEQKTAPVEATMLLAGIYSSRGDSVAALAAVDAALQADPKHLGLLQVAAQIAGSAKDDPTAKKAVDYFRRATAQAPKNGELWKAWAGHHVRRSETDRAEDVLRAAVKAQPEDPQRTLALAEFLAVARSRDVAEKELLAAIGDRPKDTALRFGLVNLYRAAGRPADARRVLEEIASTGPDSPSGLQARNQLAAESLARGRVADARVRVDEVLKASPRDSSALLMRGRILLGDGDARGAVLDLRAALRDQPGLPEVAGLLAQAHRRAGEAQLAREVLVDAVKFKPGSVDLRLLLAADMADAKEFRDANAEIDNAIKAAPADLRSHDMKAGLALAQKDTMAAEKVYVALKAAYPSEPGGFLRLGKLYADQKKYAAALKEYDEAARLAPDAAEPALFAIGVFVAERRFDDANRRIDAIALQRPKDVLPYQLRGDVAVAKGDFALAAQSYGKLIEVAPSSPAGYRGLAQVKLALKDSAEAIAVLGRGEKAIPADASLAAGRAEMLLAAGRRAEAIGAFEALVKRFPDEDAHANNLAYVLTADAGDRAGLERALALATRFKESSNPGYLDSLGWANYRLGRYDEAVAVLDRAVKGAPDAPLFHLHLGMALHRKGDHARAREHLGKAVAGNGALADIDEAKSILAQR